MSEKPDETLLTKSKTLLGPAAMGLLWSPVLASVLYVTDPLGWHTDAAVAEVEPVPAPDHATIEEIAFVARELGEGFPPRETTDHEADVTLLRGALPDDAAHP